MMTSSLHTDKELVRKYPASLTTLVSRSVVFDVDVFLASLRTGAAGQDTSPVDSVMVAELLVPRDVDAAVVYFPQRAQPQGGQRGDLHHQKRVAPVITGSQ